MGRIASRRAYSEMAHQYKRPNEGMANRPVCHSMGVGGQGVLPGTVHEASKRRFRKRPGDVIAATIRSLIGVYQAYRYR